MLDRLMTLDLTGLYIILSLTGALLAVYVMQATWHDPSSQNDPHWLQWSRRFGLWLLGLALGWSLLYLVQRGYRPEPHEVLLVIAVNIIYVGRSILLYLHRNDAKPSQLPHRAIRH